MLRQPIEALSRKLISDIAKDPASHILDRTRSGTLMDTGLVMPALVVALDGLSRRQAAIANNVANINTPGYLAQNVDFESALASAVDMQPDAGTSQLGGVISTATSAEPAGLDGNNVNLDQQTLLGTETNLRFQMALRAVEGRFTVMRDVLRGS
ncbi:MAG: flagellar basal body protein [Candidatus Nanopelagicales bacterium]